MSFYSAVAQELNKKADKSFPKDRWLALEPFYLNGFKRLTKYCACIAVGTIRTWRRNDRKNIIPPMCIRVNDK